MPGSAARDHGTSGKSGFGPALRGPCVYLCVGLRDFGTVIGGCSSVLFYVVGSVETVTHPCMCVGWVTVFYSFMLVLNKRSPGSCGV